MKIGFYNYYDFYNHNKMFLSSDSPIGDDLAYSFNYLGKYLTNLGYEVATIDSADLNSFDIVIFIDLPKKNNEYFKKIIKQNRENLYLIIMESPLIRPENWEIKNHKFFKKILTWNPQLVDEKKYFQFYLPNKLNSDLIFGQNRNKFCTMIAGNKITEYNKDELYTERIKAIRWFEYNYPQKFDLYGYGWEQGEPNDYLKRLIQINRFTVGGYKRIANTKFISVLKPFFTPYYSYKGSVLSKKEILSQYRFSICYENLKGVNGYITEKIFDCFLSGCIPIYLGANDIKNHIPSSTFIDKRDFVTYDNLYKYLNGMTKVEYENYIHAISIFLKSADSRKFSAEYFAETIYKNIILE